MPNYSFVQYTGDGVTNQYSVPFPYLDKSHVDVKVDTVSVAFTWVTDSLVQITATPPNLSAIEIRRTTALAARVVDFADGSMQSEVDHDNSALQNFYHTQEIEDWKVNSIQLASDGTLDAANRRIKNVTNPTQLQDAATKDYVDDAFLTAGGHPLLNHNDAVNAAPVAGDVVVANDTPAWVRFARGNDKDILEVDTAANPKFSWRSLAAKMFQMLTTKGDLIGSTGATTQRVGVGANDTLLVADSAQATGWGWKTLETWFTNVFGAASAGDILTRGASAWARKAVSADTGKVLRVAAKQADKLKYEFVGLPESFNGLLLRNHPDSDKTYSHVFMQRCRYLVTDKGTMVKPRQGLVADITASGAGGLDTGAEAASTCYEVYYIFKGQGSSGTPDDPEAPAADAIMLHQAKDYSQDTGYDGASDTDGLLRSASTNERLAQGFKTTISGLCEFVEVNVGRSGSPTGNIWFTIEADSAGSPSGTPLATTDKYDVSRFSVTAGAIRFVFRTPASLTAATQYHLVAYGDFTISGVNHIKWRYKNTTNPYADGEAKQYNGSAWSALGTTADLTFLIYITRNDTAVTMPTGYTEKCLIGYVQNNGSSNLHRFQQNERSYRVYIHNHSNVQIVNETASGVTLQSVSGFIPPVPVLLYLGLTGTGAAVAHLSFGTFSHVDLNNNTSDVGGLNYQHTDNVTGESTTREVPPFFVEYQAFLYDGTAGADIYLRGFDW